MLISPGCNHTGSRETTKGAETETERLWGSHVAAGGIPASSLLGQNKIGNEMRCASSGVQWRYLYSHGKAQSFLESKATTFTFKSETRKSLEEAPAGCA